MRPLVGCVLLALATLVAQPAFAHGGHHSQAAWDACEDRTLGDACAYQDSAHNTYRGTCRAIADDLMCVRNAPIERPESSEGDEHLTVYPGNPPVADAVASVR